MRPPTSRSTARFVPANVSKTTGYVSGDPMSGKLIKTGAVAIRTFSALGYYKLWVE
jgi:hypothetical protein